MKFKNENKKIRKLENHIKVALLCLPRPHLLLLFTCLTTRGNVAQAAGTLHTIAIPNGWVERFRLLVPFLFRYNLG